MQTRIQDRIRDAILVVTVGASLFATGWAFHDPGDVPSPPKTGTESTTPVVHEPAQ